MTKPQFVTEAEREEYERNERKRVADGVVNSMLHDMVAACAIHCLNASAPGISADLRRVIANNIARRAVLRFRAGASE